MAACTMIALFGISAEEALYRVQAYFDTRSELGEALDTHSRQAVTEDWQYACCGLGLVMHDSLMVCCRLSPVTSYVVRSCAWTHTCMALNPALCVTRV